MASYFNPYLPQSGYPVSYGGISNEQVNQVVQQMPKI